MAHPDQKIEFAPLSAYADNPRFVRLRAQFRTYPNSRSAQYGPASPQEVAAGVMYAFTAEGIEIVESELEYLFNRVVNTWHKQSPFVGHVQHMINQRFEETYPQARRGYRIAILFMSRERKRLRREEGSTITYGDPSTRRPPERPRRKKRS